MKMTSGHVFTMAALLACIASAGCPGDDVDLGDDRYDCTGMEVAGSGQCNQTLGWMWDGYECYALAGCECSGADCDELMATVDECVETYSDQCFGIACSSEDGAEPCPLGRYCRAPNHGCGPGTCLPVPAPEVCEQPDQTGPVCGCDGETYANLCQAHSLGVAVDTFEACGS